VIKTSSPTNVTSLFPQIKSFGNPTIKHNFRSMISLLIRGNTASCSPIHWCVAVWNHRSELWLVCQC